MGGYVRSVTRVTGSPNIHYYQEASAGSANAFYAGDLVQLDAAGELVIADGTAILGIAEKTATGTASTEIPVDVISAEELFIMKSSETTLEAHAQDFGAITFTLSATAGHTVASGGANTDECRIIDHHPADPWGTLNGRLIVKFLDAELQMGETLAKAT